MKPLTCLKEEVDEEVNDAVYNAIQGKIKLDTWLRINSAVSAPIPDRQFHYEIWWQLYDEIQKG